MTGWVRARMMLNSLVISALLGCASAAIKLVTNTSDTVYFEDNGRDAKIGYSFSLHQNVLSVELNATVSSGGCCGNNNSTEPASLIIMPNLLLEFKDPINSNSTKSAYGFLDKANNNTDWGKGLSASKYQSKDLKGKSGVDVWRVKADWKNPDGGKPKFSAQMYFASAPTQYQNMSLNAHSILVRYSILDFPYKMSNSSVGYEQIILESSAMNNVTIANLTEPKKEDGLITFLRVNKTALIDGKPQKINIGSLNTTEEALSIMAGNSTEVDISQYQIGELFLEFANSSNAKNITFDQRLVLNVTELRAQSNVTAQNSASKLAGPASIWIQLGVATASALLAAVAFIL